MSRVTHPARGPFTFIIQAGDATVYITFETRSTPARWADLAAGSAALDICSSNGTVKAEAWGSEVRFFVANSSGESIAVSVPRASAQSALRYAAKHN